MSYVHFAAEPDVNMPVIMCSFCNEQNLVVSREDNGSRLRLLTFRCVRCDHVWEFDFDRMVWEGYSVSIWAS